jgi:CRISPR-associated protein Cas2
MLARMARQLYLVAYDVSDPDRLRRTLKLVKAYRAAGQRSVAECLMSPAEYEGLSRDLSRTIDHGVDRLHIFRLDPRMRPTLFGVAVHQGDRPFIIA